MAITRIRGGQLHDRTIGGLKIQQGALLNEHVASNAAISESKLDINWASHTEILENKKVVDYVQVNGTDVGGLREVDVTAASILPGNDPGVLSDPLSGEGVIVDSPKNRVPLRDSVTGDPVLDDQGKEVYGRIIKLPADQTAGTSERFVVHFYTTDSANIETPFDMPAGQKIDWQYARRFNLLTINEMFASNEKFVEAAADITAHLNIEQLAKDLYGPIFNLDRDGNGNLQKSLAEQITDENARAVIAETNLQTNIDGEAAARIAADNSIINDISSTSVGKGASLIGVADAGNKFIADNLEDVLAELESKIGTAQNGNIDTNAEVIAARTSNIKSKVFANLDERIEELEKNVSDEVVRATGIESDLETRLDDVETELAGPLERTTATTNGHFPIATFTSLAERFADIESKTDEGLQKASGSNTEITDARGTKNTLDERLDVALNEDGTLKAGTQIHDHKKTILQINAAAQIVNMPVGETFVTDGTLNVYVNGILQANGINFIDVLDLNGAGIGVDFGTDEVLAGDIVILEWIKYNDQ